jgi:aldehyde dehydrogenase (NAD+)
MSLLLEPMAAAYAAGNVVVCKPSEVSENSTRAMAELLPKYLDPAGYAWIEGAAEETKRLLANKVLPV